MENESNEKKPLSMAEWVFYTVVGLVFVGILMSIGPGAFRCGPISAEKIKATSNARNIALALNQYATDHDGEFPKGKTALEVFSQLLPPSVSASGYIIDKSMFFVKGSQYTPKPITGGDPIKLAARENHWGVMGNLKDDDKANPRWPLVFDGPATPDGRYSSYAKQKGGRWEGKVAIVVRLDCSAKAERLTDLQVKTDGQENVLQPSTTWMPEGKLLMPY